MQDRTARMVGAARSAADENHRRVAMVEGSGGIAELAHRAITMAQVAAAMHMAAHAIHVAQRNDHDSTRAAAAQPARIER